MDQVNEDAYISETEHVGSCCATSSASQCCDEHGMATAELLGNAALGIGALVVIWGLLQTLGVNVIGWMGQQIGVG